MMTTTDRLTAMIDIAGGIDADAPRTLTRTQLLNRTLDYLDRPDATIDDAIAIRNALASDPDLPLLD